MKSLLFFLFGVACAVGFNFASAYYVVGEKGEIVQAIDDNNLKYATTTFSSVADYEKTLIETEYQEKIINKLDLILKELYKLNKK